MILLWIFVSLVTKAQYRIIVNIRLNIAPLLCCKEKYMICKIIFNFNTKKFLSLYLFINDKAVKILIYEKIAAAFGFIKPQILPPNTP